MTVLAPARVVAPWVNARVAVVHGIGDKRIDTGEEFETCPLGRFWNIQPTNKPKHQGNAFLPSLYHECDAREHRAQRERGQFVALVGDFDKGNHSISVIEDFARELVGDGAYLVHSTANAAAGDMRWRLILPLAEPVSFDVWRDAQEACFEVARGRGIEMDGVTERAGQVSFLPNVPNKHDKTGQPLRGGDGQPLYYASASSSLQAQGLCLKTGPLADTVADLRSRREQDERQRAQMREQAQRRRSSQAQSDAGSVVDEFNRSNSVTDLLQHYNYEQSPRNPDDWRSPHQTSGTFATRVFEDRWVSLSGSDCAAGLGTPGPSGCYGDAYDLFVHWEHNGNQSTAWKQACQEQGRARSPRQQDPTWTQEDSGREAGDPGWTEGDFDYADSPGAPSVPKMESRSSRIEASPYVWCEPNLLPRRPWIFGRWLLRGSVFVVIAPGAAGKSTLITGLGMSLCSGRPLLSHEVWGGAKRVWIWNLEDSLADLRFSLQAAALHWNIKPEDVAGHLFVDSGLDGATLKLARRGRDGPEIDREVSAQIVAELKRREIDVLVVDPFISSHGLNDENDNATIDMVAKEWARIATAAGCAVILVHHSKKMNGGEVTAESSRGASSLIDAARGGLALNPMTKAEAEGFCIAPEDRRRFVRAEDAKPNRAPAGSGQWFEIVSVDLGNGPDGGDSVGVATPWKAPDPFDDVSVRDLESVQAKIADGNWRENAQAKDWAGRVVADVLGLDLSDQADKKKAKSILATWVKNGALRVQHRPDKNGDDRPFVVVGKVS